MISGGAMHHAPKNRNRTHRVRIKDPDGLQSLLRDLGAPHKTQTEAAKALGISQPTFSRLLTGAVSDEMSFETYAAILTALGGEPKVLGRGPRATPFAVFAEYLDPGARAQLEFRAEREQRRKGERVGERDRADLQAVLDAEAQAAYELLERFLDAIVTEDEEYVWSNYEVWMDRELTRLKPLSESVLRELWEDRRARSRIADFLERVGRSRGQLPSEGDSRCWLALYRAVEPLTAAATTWQVERSWEELREKNELKGYLKAALKREELLLKPTRDLDRVRRGVPPMGYWEAMELMAAQAAFFEDHPSATYADWEGALAAYDALIEADASVTDEHWPAIRDEYEAYFREQDPPLGWKDWERAREALSRRERSAGAEGSGM
jgi:transcriptional regulator with XRE-family HTH domain